MADWYAQRFNDLEYNRRKAHILAHGRPVKLRFADKGDFACIFVDPEPAFVPLANDRAIAEAQATGWNYHSTVTAFSAMSAADKTVWGQLKADGDSLVVDLAVQRVTRGATAELAWVGLGADARLWDLFLKGPAGWKYREHHHGLHVSM